jgi:hypothetical protein
MLGSAPALPYLPKGRHEIGLNSVLTSGNGSPPFACAKFLNQSPLKLQWKEGRSDLKRD